MSKSQIKKLLMMRSISWCNVKHIRRCQIRTAIETSTLLYLSFHFICTIIP